MSFKELWGDSEQGTSLNSCHTNRILMYRHHTVNFVRSKVNSAHYRREYLLEFQRIPDIKPTHQKQASFTGMRLCYNEAVADKKLILRRNYLFTGRKHIKNGKKAYKNSEVLKP